MGVLSVTEEFIIRSFQYSLPFFVILMNFSMLVFLVDIVDFSQSLAGASHLFLIRVE